MTLLLYLLILYALLGLLFNIASLIRSLKGQSPLTGTQPASGILVMFLVFFVTISFEYAASWFFLLGWCFLIAKIFPTGIVRHARAISSKTIIGNQYAYPSMAYVACGINIFGLSTALITVTVCLINKLNIL